MDRSIAFREYAQLEGTLALAFRVSEPHKDELISLVLQVNYFGKRGSFFQLRGQPHTVENLPAEFIPLDGVAVQGTQVQGQLPKAFVAGQVQIMDDWGESLTFDKLNIFSEEKIRLGTDRIRKSVILPYRLVRSSKSFSYYERISP
ncbi:MAG: hypothetical protein H5T60_12900 [Anaerolineae bacterium]|nr:hypothetical protein [Anaerolineae bacterium]